MAGVNVPCDAEACIDNQVDEYVKALGGSLGDGEQAQANLEAMNAALEDNLATGKHGVLVEIGEWDGKPDDDSITLALYNVTSLFPGDDGRNEYTVDPASQVETGPRFLARGYVAKNTIVARGFAFDMLLQLALSTGQPGGGTVPLTMTVPFRNALFVGTVNELGTDSVAMLDAQITGALPVQPLLEQVSRFRLCPETSNAFAKACELLDLSVAAPGNLAAPCDSLSFAIAMDFTHAARVGSLAASADDLSDAGPACTQAPACP